MRIVREGQWTRLALLVGVLVAAAQACSLNPQPIPPGADERSGGEFSSDASASARADGGTSMPPAQGADSGNGENMDAAPPIPAVDGGVDGLDAAADAPTDAPIDAPDDAPTDTGSD